MSYTPKKLHEEGNRKRPLEESCFYSTPRKMIQPPDDNFHLPLESGQDGRSSKIQRSDPRDVDRKSSLLHQRTPSPGNYLDHRVVSRSELIFLKDSSVKAETRETIRELYADTRIDRQGTRRDEKETRPDRGPYSCFKGDLKFGRESYSAANSHSTLKEAKGHHRANCLEPSSGLGPRRAAQHCLINANEFANNRSTYENISLAAHMALEVNRVNTEGDGKHREKNIEKDKKHKDFVERDKSRNGSRNIMQVRVVNEFKEPLEEREKWRVTEINIPEQDKDQDNKKGPNQSERIPDRDIIELQQEDGDTQRNGDLFENDVQQHSRMLRSLETFQGPQLVSGALNHERYQVQSGVAAFVYKPGDCAEVLLKSWREFKASQDVKNHESYPGGPTLQIQIPAEYVTATNSQVRTCQLWGEDIYTNDSDIVAVLMHTGYCRLTASSFPAIHELHATIRVLPPQDWYAAKTKNKIRSRACGTYTGCSFCVERCCAVKKDGGTIDLEPYLIGELTLAPVSEEHTMTARTDASNSLRPQKFLPEVAIQYNLCNEPWLKYSMNVVADKGLKKSLYTAARLKTGEVLYLETVLDRFELCFSGERTVCDDTNSIFTQAQELKNKHSSHSSLVPNGEKSTKNHEALVDVFRWSRCKKPLPQKLMRSIGIPLPTVQVQVLAENLEWEDVQWTQTGVWVAGKKYLLARAHFLSPA